MLCTFFVVACQPKYYVPNSHQVTRFTEEGDVNLNFNADGNQFEIQGAYALTDQFAAAANFSRFAPRDQDNGNGGSGFLFEVAPGYYKPFRDNMVFEAFGLAGFGRVENHFPSLADSLSLNPEISANAFRVGVQPGLSLLYDRFSIGLSTRVSNLTYVNIDGNLSFDGVDQVEFLTDNRSNFLVEPALTARFGTDKFRGQAQYGFSYNASNSEFLQNRQYLTIGFNINLNLEDIDL